ncbi:hypothetical protein K2F54_03050 [Cryobacterium sp. 1639]|uniref:protein kinase domain-containing protein n=1 Tax=Cryobacterium inferilacus TaxID=2866629 RepID=UPI001C73DE23|nr:hypothetical protein [Cryobacterium sp. 1639]MBX0298947.1 hypothetical protein [Cryobacterium sp. 1639]
MGLAGGAAVPDTLVGYRVIRRIGVGGQSLVFLARAASAGGDAPPVALKVFRRQTDPARIGREVHALLATPATTLARLEDVASTPDGRVCLVLEYLPGFTLDRLLAVRGRIKAAEVVTIAATITATLQALHETGLTHPMVRTSSVRFDRCGRPVLLGLGDLGELPGGAAGVGPRRDAVVSLTGFLNGLLAYLDTAEAAGASALLAEFQSTLTVRPFPADLTSLESALFTWAAAGPVDCLPNGPAEAGAPVSIPAAVPRLMAVAAAGGVAPAPPVEPGRRRAAALPAARGAARAAAQRAAQRPTVQRLTGGRAVVRRRLSDAVERSRAALSWLRMDRRRAARPRSRPDSQRRSVGRPLLLGGTLVVVLSVGGIAALEGGSALSGGSALLGGSMPEATVPSVPEPAPVGDPGPGAAAGHNGERQEKVGSEQMEADRTVVESDDPAAAVLELLRQREACLAAASVLCLDGVNQAGSVAMAADGYTIRQAQATPNASGDDDVPGNAPPVTAVVQERTGNAALVVLAPGPDSDSDSDAPTRAEATVNTQPASALVIKGEAGWRLRELFDY